MVTEPKTRYTILIVDDFREAAEMLASYFEAQGYQVATVGWGKDALAFIEEFIPDLIMLDIHLPDIDGYEVCRHLRSHRRTKNIPIIFLTSYTERGNRLTGLELGAADYVIKPFNIQELRLRVRNVLRRSSEERGFHPITGLPVASLVDERLRELLTTSDWTVLSVGVLGLRKFAEAYGFVARDDVVRAVALMLDYVVNEGHDPDAFVGHLDDTDFFVVIAPDKVEQAQQTLRVRLDETMAFFYPRADWEASQVDPSVEFPRMDVTMGVLQSSASSNWNNLEDLKQAIIEVQRAE